MKRIAIIGAGLAGTACAYILRQRGLEPVIYEAGYCIAPGASGNNLGLYNPRFSAERSAESEFFTSAYELALKTFAQLSDIGWNPCGSLHLITDQKKEKRFHQCASNSGWGEDDMQILSAHDASKIAGVELQHDALFLPRSGFVSPQKLCAHYADGIEIHLNAAIKDIADIKADAIILANGMGAKKFIDLPLKAVRGQVTQIKSSPVSQKIKCNLCYGGYITPAIDGGHMVGASFQRWLDHAEIIPEDDAGNIAKMIAAVPALKGDYDITGHRAAVRTTTDRHFPIAGHIKDNLYVSTAHGSHGILSSLTAAELIADLITGKSPALHEDVVGKLAPPR